MFAIPNEMASSEKVGIEQTSVDMAADQDELPPAHSDYLLKRHGTLVLDPTPSHDPADPLNLPNWKVPPLGYDAEQ
jgi:hypothetical protein